MGSYRLRNPLGGKCTYEQWLFQSWTNVFQLVESPSCLLLAIFLQTKLQFLTYKTKENRKCVFSVYLLCDFQFVLLKRTLGGGNYTSFMSHDMTKPIKWVYTQRRLISTWASAQSDQGLRLLCAQWVAKDPRFLHADSEDSDQTRLRPGWSESSLAAHSFCWFCLVAAHIGNYCRFMYSLDRKC